MFILDYRNSPACMAHMVRRLLDLGGKLGIINVAEESIHLHPTPTPPSGDPRITSVLHHLSCDSKQWLAYLLNLTGVCHLIRIFNSQDEFTTCCSRYEIVEKCCP
jgi:hypothetical protein